LQEGIRSVDSHTLEEEDDGMCGLGKKMLTDDAKRSSHAVAPQKPNCPHTPSRVLRRAVVPEAPALPQPRAREITGQRSPSSSGVVVSMFLLFLERRRIEARTLIPATGRRRGQPGRSGDDNSRD
jgi:hypothetical protein